MQNIKIYLIWLLFLILISCNNSEKNARIQELESQLEKAKVDNELFSYNQKILNECKLQNEELRKQLRQIKTNDKKRQQSEIKTIFDYIPAILKIDETYATSIFEHLTYYGRIDNHLQPNDSHEFIYVLYENLNINYNSFDPDRQLAFYLFNKLRDPLTISFLYNAHKEIIFKYLSSKREHKFDGIHNIVKCLLSSYDDIKDQPDALIDLYQKALTQKPNYETYDGLISQKTRDLLKSSEINHDLVWCYSFWVRRYNENSMEVVHDILVDVDIELSK